MNLNSRSSLFIFLTLVAISIWLAVFSVSNNLSIIACDVGQGDVILLSKNTTQILIDSGPDRQVLDCLGKYMPFWDRDLELFILTHTDKDHSGGLADVFKSYNVKNILTNDFKKEVFSSDYTRVLENVVGGSGAVIIYPYDLPNIRVGMIYLDIVHPNKDYSSNKTNNYSIVINLKYQNFKAIFTGDIETGVSDDLSENKKIGQVNYIKIPHHGSKNGLSEKLLNKLMPEIAVISAGKNNRYGHPHKEIIQMLNAKKVKILRTDQMGDVVYKVKTD